MEEDSSLGLTRSGVLRLRLPNDPANIGSWQEALEPELAGVGDLPPPIDDRRTERLVTWIRCFRPNTGSTTPLPNPVVAWVDVNVVDVEQAVTAQPEIIGNGTGRPSQVFRLSHTPVLADSLVIEVREPEPVGWVKWRSVEDFAGSGSSDPDYVLDRASGEVSFGDGVRGACRAWGKPFAQ